MLDYKATREHFGLLTGKENEEHVNHSFSVSAMERSDLPEVLRLEREIFSDAWTEDNLKSTFEFASYHSFVVRHEGLAIGYLLFMSAVDEGELLRIGVNPGFRRQGVAQLLMEAMTQYAKKESISHIYLEVRMSNEPAKALYVRNGFEQAGIRKKYYHDPVEDACIMTASLEVI